MNLLATLLLSAVLQVTPFPTFVATIAPRPTSTPGVTPIVCIAQAKQWVCPTMEPVEMKPRAYLPVITQP